MKSIIFILWILSSGSAISQTVISGSVFDFKDRDPLPGASVYFDGTTIGTITNDDGQFYLEPDATITAPLVISYIGYQDYYLTLGEQTEDLEIAMQPSAMVLGEVRLSNDPFTREEKLVAFREQFLGTSEAGRSCRIINEDAIRLVFSPVNNELTASATEPIIIENKYLGYTIRFSMQDFSIQYSKRTLKPWNINQTYYAGSHFFIDRKPGVPRYRRRRDKAYLGSALHVMRTIAGEDWKAKKFAWYKGGFPTAPSKSFEVEPTEKLTRITMKDTLLLVYDDMQQTTMYPRYNNFTIDGYGNHYPADAILFSGTIGDQRMGDSLPLDYGLE